MTANELATLLREEVPRIKKHAAEFPYKDALRSDEADLLSALDAAVGLLREVTDAASKPLVVMKKRFPPNVSYTVDYLEVHQENSKVLADVLATLRLVVGEKETPDA